MTARDIEAQIAAREAEILGKLPRILPLTPEEIDVEAALANYEKIRGASSGNTAPATFAEIPELVLTVQKHAQLFERVSDLSVALLTQGVLPRRDMRLAILRTTWLCQAPYPFGEHVRHARREGMSTEEIERIQSGPDQPGWNRHERALLTAVGQLHANAAISDETWAILAEQLDEKQLFELTVLVGQFTLVSYFQNGLRLRLRPENAGLRAR